MLHLRNNYVQNFEAPSRALPGVRRLVSPWPIENRCSPRLNPEAGAILGRRVPIVDGAQYTNLREAHDETSES